MPNVKHSQPYYIGQWMAFMYVGERGSGATMVAVPGFACQGQSFAMPCQWAVTD